MTDSPTVPRFTTDTRILITGASGFVGGHLLRALHAEDAKLFAIHAPGETPPANGQAEWYTMDLTRSGVPESLVRDLRPHIVVHLAAQLKAERNWNFAEESFEANLATTHNLMLALGRHAPDLRRLVLMGSAEEYGNVASLPVTEDCPAHPVSPYSAAKAAATQLAQLYYELFRLPVTILRPFILYGPAQSASMMIPQLIASALRGEDFPMTGGEQTRDFVFVGDAVDCLLRAMHTAEANGRIFNVCTGVETSIRSVAECIMGIMTPAMTLRIGALPYRRNEVWRLVGSFEAARRLLGWSPATDLDSGLRTTIEWYRHNHTEVQ